VVGCNVSLQNGTIDELLIIMLEKMDSNLEQIRAWRKEMKAHQEAMEANPDEMKSVAVHEVVPKEEAAVKCFGALTKRRGDRHLAVRRRRKPKKRIHGEVVSWKKLAACRVKIHRAGVAWRTGRHHEGSMV
jgi:hypothetical protein